jgi:murein endopeptidase
MYTELMKQFIHKKYWKHPNMVKFIELLTNENHTNRKKLGIIVYKSFGKRNEMLYGSVEL